MKLSRATSFSLGSSIIKNYLSCPAYLLETKLQVTNCKDTFINIACEHSCDKTSRKYLLASRRGSIENGQEL